MVSRLFGPWLFFAIEKIINIFLHLMVMESGDMRIPEIMRVKCYFSP